MSDFGYAVFASYGNDSIAVIQWCHENGLENVATVYNDTGWAARAWPARVEQAEAWVRSLGYAPHRTKSEGMKQLVRSRKAWPRQGIQFCTDELKIQPSQQWLDARDPLGLVTCVNGVRREESENRKNTPFRLMVSPAHGGRALWSPLAGHTEEQRDALLARAGFEPLPHRSMECFPCVNSNRADLRLLDETTIAEIEKFETELGHTSKGKPRTMFRPYRYMGATGIREIYRWALSPRGKFDIDDGTGGGGCDGGYCGT